VTVDEILDETEFICQRTLWLKRQPRNADGVLLRQDDRDEAGVMDRRISELMEILVAVLD
jgi:hypothetical protein